MTKSHREAQAKATVDRRAREALAAARADAKPIKPDAWHTSEGRTYGTVTAATVHAAARELLAKHGLAVELVSATVHGNNYQVTWTWSWCDEGSSWTSSPIRVDVPLAFERGEALAAAAACVTTARKVFLIQLLELQQDQDHEAALANTTETAKVGVGEHVARALASYCAATGVSEDRAIRQFTGWAGPGSITVAGLPPFMVAALWGRLLAHMPTVELSTPLTSRDEERRA